MDKISYIAPAEVPDAYADRALPVRTRNIAGQFEMTSRARITLNAIPILLNGDVEFNFQGVPPGVYALGEQFIEPGVIHLFQTNFHAWNRDVVFRDEEEARAGLFIAADEEPYTFYTSERSRFKKPFQFDGRGGDSVEILPPSMTVWTVDSIAVGSFPFPAFNEYSVWVYPDEYLPDWDYSLNPIQNFRKTNAEVSGHAVALEIETEELAARETMIDSARTFASRAVKFYAAEPVYAGFSLYAYITDGDVGSRYRIRAEIARNRTGGWGAWERLHLATKAF